MYKIGEYIMYGNSGVCKVSDICTLPHSQNETDLYYMLQPAFDEKSKIYIPVNNHKVFMRKIYTKSEVNQLIESISDLKSFWIEDRRERELKFKESLRSHDSINYIRMLKGLYLERQVKDAEGKNLSNSDSHVLDIAEKLLFGEFAVALSIPVESVMEYIGTSLEAGV